MMSEVKACLGLAHGAVRLVSSDARWPVLFEPEADRIRHAVGREGLSPLVLEHVGSTAVSGLIAKPILDLMAGYGPVRQAEPYIRVCQALGYRARGPQGVAERELMVLGAEDARTHHLSLVRCDGAFWHEHLLFRERLRADPALAVMYGALKRELSTRYGGERGAAPFGADPGVRPSSTAWKGRACLT